MRECVLHSVRDHVLLPHCHIPGTWHSLTQSAEYMFIECMHLPGLWRSLSHTDGVWFFCPVGCRYPSLAALTSHSLLRRTFPSPGAAQTSVALLAEAVGNFSRSLSHLSAFLSDDTRRRMEEGDLPTQKLLQGSSPSTPPAYFMSPQMLTLSWSAFVDFRHP